MSLATLWLQDQSRVLEELQMRHFEPRIVKTAAIGLTRAHLGQTVTALSSHLHRLHAQYGVHVCGEGGEYESLVTDCPLYCARIVLDRTSLAVHSDIPYAEVYLLRVHSCHLELKSPQVTLAPLRHVHLTADPALIRSLLHSWSAQQQSYLAAIDTSALSVPRSAFRVCGRYFWLTVESTAHVTDVEVETVQLLSTVRGEFDTCQCGDCVVNLLARYTCQGWTQHAVLCLYLGISPRYEAIFGIQSGVRCLFWH